LASHRLASLVIDLTGIRALKETDEPYERGLARATFAYDTIDGIGWDLETDIVNRMQRNPYAR
jgi:hypothetical protein